MRWKAPNHLTMLFVARAGVPALKPVVTWIILAFIQKIRKQTETMSMWTCMFEHAKNPALIFACEFSISNNTGAFSFLHSFTSAAAVCYVAQTRTFGHFHFRVRHFTKRFILISRVCRFCHSSLHSHPLVCFPLLLEYCHGNTHFYCNIKRQFDPDLPSICLVKKVYEVDECLHICSPS